MSLAISSPSVPSRGRSKQRSLWSFAISAAAILVYAASPLHNRYPATVVTIVCFGVVTALVPSAAVRIERPVCPMNWFLLLFFIQLVVNPVLICLAGPYRNTLPELPDSVAVNVAELVEVIGFLGFAVGCELHRRRTPFRREWPLPELAPHPARSAAIFLGLGVLGLIIAYHTPAALLAYFKSPSGHVGLTGTGGGGPGRVASLILRSCLQFGAIVPWCVWLDRRRPSGWRLWAVTVPVGAFVAVAEATFAYNRGSIAAPLIALLAAVGVARIRIRLPVLIAIGLLAFAVLAGARSYRNSPYSLGQVITNAQARSYVVSHTNLGHELQIYANAPQYLGYWLDRDNYGAHPTYGRTVLSSILGPIPTLGKPFRATSGPTLFNRQIYGPYRDTVDQLAPFHGELLLDFSFPGVFVGFALLGLLAGALERGFRRAREALRAFAWQYATIWIAFLVIGSAAVTSQQLIYFYWPIVGLSAAAEWRRRRARSPLQA